MSKKVNYRKMYEKSLELTTLMNTEIDNLFRENQGLIAALKEKEAEKFSQNPSVNKVFFNTVDSYRYHVSEKKAEALKDLLEDFKKTEINIELDEFAYSFFKHFTQQKIKEYLREDIVLRIKKMDNRLVVKHYTI